MTTGVLIMIPFHGVRRAAEWASFACRGRHGAVIRSFVATVVLLLAMILWLSNGANGFGADEVSRSIHEAGTVGAAVFVLAMAGSVLLGPIPTAPFAIAAGAIYGAVAGTALALSGGLIGAIAAFLIARALQSQIPQAALQQALGRAQILNDQRALFWSVLGLRLVPALSFALVSYGAGVSAISLQRFAVATGLGMLPMTALCAVTGSGWAILP